MRLPIAIAMACFCFFSQNVMSQDAVSFDSRAIFPCTEVKSPQQAETTGKVILIVIPVSANFAAEESSVENLHYEFDFPKSMTILDHYPKTQTGTDVAGLTEQERREHQVIDLNVSFGGGGSIGFSLFGLSENASRNNREFKEVETNARSFHLPPRGQVIVAGTANEGQTLYFDLKWSNQITRAGQTDYAFLAEVPKDWRGDTTTLSCKASQGGSDAGRLSKIVGFYPNGDNASRQYVEGLLKAVKPAVKESKEIITNSIGTRLKLIPAGSFLRGAATDDINASDHEKPQRTITISKPFYIGVYEVTQYEYRQVMNDNPSEFKDSEQQPVEQVSWLDAVRFCNKLSELEKRKPYYKIDGEGVRILGGRGYRLPTEAEWEYACAAQMSPSEATIYSFGNDKGKLGDYAWFYSNSGSKTYPVGKLKPNRWGLYDMHGNVSEWCQDWYSDSYYTHASDKDPLGPNTGSNRVFRGGSYWSMAERCRSADRLDYSPDDRSYSLGLRLALEFSPDEQGK
jgi:formylglycine-generating enzyme required for sulfatase activity